MTKTLTSEEMKSEMHRRKSRRDDLLDAFEQQGELFTGQVFTIAGSGASSRIKELRRKGFIILSSYQEPGNYLYTYLGNREDDDQTTVSTVD